MKLIECVPNFSEGRDRSVIDAITAEISGTSGAALLDVDAGAATHRTVVTFAGPPEAVEEAAFRAIRRAAELIDMRRHRGEHPRIGATDVCPFVPMRGATMQDCIEIARRLGRRVGTELGIPVYLYGAAATRPERRRLPDIREGEYEALPRKLERPEFAPDFGPATFNARSGATVIGAREFLIAWNVNLNTRDRKLAARIAAELRETGKLQRDAAGAIVRDGTGKPLSVPGRFAELQGGGWYIREYGRAQLTFNVMSHTVAPLHEVFDAALIEASSSGSRRSRRCSPRATTIWRSRGGRPGCPSPSASMPRSSRWGSTTSPRSPRRKRCSSTATAALHRGCGRSRSARSPTSCRPTPPRRAAAAPRPCAARWRRPSPAWWPR
jgi:glutamate formiminotransferase/formiminotetrahydrofolate cyclodeaminase